MSDEKPMPKAGDRFQMATDQGRFMAEVEILVPSAAYRNQYEVGFKVVEVEDSYTGDFKVGDGALWPLGVFQQAGSN